MGDDQPTAGERRRLPKVRYVADSCDWHTTPAAAVVTPTLPWRFQGGNPDYKTPFRSRLDRRVLRSNCPGQNGGPKSMKRHYDAERSTNCMTECEPKGSM